MEKIKVTCYGKTQEWDSREEAQEFYLLGILNTDGSEKNRYIEIYSQLCAGCMECSDLED